jgi:hypothetical protein
MRSLYPLVYRYQPYFEPRFLFIVVGAGSKSVGLLLLPMVIVHAILIVLLGGVWLKVRRSPDA